MLKTNFTKKEYTFYIEKVQVETNISKIVHQNSLRVCYKIKFKFYFNVRNVFW